MPQPRQRLARPLNASSLSAMSTRLVTTAPSFARHRERQLSSTDCCRSDLRALPARADIKMLSPRRVLIVRSVRQARGNICSHALQSVSRRSRIRAFIRSVRPRATICAGFYRALRIAAIRPCDSFAVVGSQGGETIRRGRHNALECISGFGGVVGSDRGRTQASREARRCRHEHETPKSAFHSGRCPVSASSSYKPARKLTRMLTQKLASRSFPNQLRSRFRHRRNFLKSANDACPYVRHRMLSDSKQSRTRGKWRDK